MINYDQQEIAMVDITKEPEGFCIKGLTAEQLRIIVAGLESNGGDAKYRALARQLRPLWKRVDGPDFVRAEPYDY